MALQENKKDNKFILKERFEIDFSMPIPKLDANNAIAYKVKDISMDQRELFALVANNKTPPRTSILPHLKSIEHPAVLKLVEYGVVDYAPFGTQNMALIYEQPKGPKLLDIGKDSLKAITKDKERLSSIVLSLLSAAENFYGFGIPHRSIRPDNIFFKDNNLNSVVIGDCASCFAGLLQPSAYETLEMSICDDIAKGDGSEKNDFYSVGACILALLKNEPLARDCINQEIFSNKSEIGSFKFLTRDIDTPKWLHPLLIGLLEDNEINRWKYVQSYNYLKEKNYISMKQYIKRTAKAILIDNIKYDKANEVAFLLSRNKELATSLINSNKLSEWIKIGFEDDVMLTEYMQIVSSGQDENIIIAKICILIAPNLPIFYKGLRFFPQGISKAVFSADGQQISLYKEVLNSDLITFWYSKQPLSRSPSSISELNGYIKNKDLGFGIDRAIYEFDEDLPCSSPLLGGFFVNTIGGILRILDKNISPEGPLFDNAIIAFIRCKLGKKSDTLLKEINSQKKEQRALGILCLYILLQNKYGPKKLYNIAQAMANHCKPIIEIYNKKTTQDSINKRVASAAKSGILQKIYIVLDDKANIDQDTQDYNKIVKKNVMLIAEKNKILQQQSDVNVYFNKVSAKFCVLLSFFVATMSLIISIAKQLF